ncbi:unnamed protein product [Heterobilharzia americana]|nr:unnamed protein product [Heterobilharzia americana]
MLEEPSVRELNGVHSSGTWMPSNSRNRTSRCRESYCSDVDLLPPLYTTVVADYHPDGNGDLSNLANKNQKQKRNVGDISCKPDGDDDGNLMSWLMKQFKENGLDKSNLANNNFEGLDMLHEFNGSNKVSTQQNSLQRTDSGSSISSFQGVGDSKKRKSQEESSMNNCLNRSRECYESKQQHHFPRMYPPLRDSSTESRRIHDGNRSDRFLTTANSTMTTPGSANSTMLLPKGNSKYQCKLINDLFHQITKKLGVLHDCDTQIIDELKNASRIIKDLQTRKPFTPSVSSVQYNQQYQSLFRPKASTPEFCRSSNSLRKKSVIKYFPKKRINNSGETFEFPEAENKQPYSISLPHSECQSSFEKDDRKSLFLNGLFTATSERRLIQRKIH